MRKLYSIGEQIVFRSLHTLQNGEILDVFDMTRQPLYKIRTDFGIVYRYEDALYKYNAIHFKRI